MMNATRHMRQGPVLSEKLQSQSSVCEEAQLSDSTCGGEDIGKCTTACKPV